VHSVNWGDVPAWLAVVVATGGRTIALIQLRQQGNVLKGEVERNKRRDELLDGQLRELQQRTEVEERKQAEAVEFSWQPAQPLAGASAETADDSVWMAVVQNDSRRPIRDVVCRIQPDPVQDFGWGAQAVAELVDVGMGSKASKLVGPASRN
jgi:hypothetical protein